MDPVCVHPLAFRTVTPRVSVPRLPAVYRMLAVPAPDVIVPLLMVQVYVAPEPALGTEAELFLEPFRTLAAAVMVAEGSARMATFALPLAVQPAAVETVTEMVAEPPVPADQVIDGVPAPEVIVPPVTVQL